MAKKESAFFFRLDTELLERLDNQAKRMNTSRSVLIRMGIVKILEEMEETEPLPREARK